MTHRFPTQVSRSNFATFCSESLNYHGDVESVHDAMENEYPRNILTMKEETAIMSVKGTVRGVRNRVKTGIKTFLQDQKKKVSRGNFVKENKKKKMFIFRIILQLRMGCVWYS